jgi:hypothetical protein
MTLSALEHAIFQHIARYGQHPSKLVLGPSDGVEIAGELHRSGLDAWAGATVDSLTGRQIMGLEIEVLGEFQGFQLFN